METTDEEKENDESRYIANFLSWQLLEYVNSFPLLVACARVFMSLCRSVGRSVGPLSLHCFQFFYEFFVAFQQF